MMAREAKRHADTPPPAPVAWFDMANRPPPGFPVLTTLEPEGDHQGAPGRYYTRRQFIDGRWQRTKSWVHPLTLIPLDPQPTHWRIDPSRGSLDVPVE